MAQLQWDCGDDDDDDDDDDALDHMEYTEHMLTVGSHHRWW